AGDDVHQRLGADELRERRRRDGVAELRPDAGDLVENGIEAVLEALGGELRLERSRHPARELVLVDPGIELLACAERMPLLERDRLHVPRNRLERAPVDSVRM